MNKQRKLRNIVALSSLTCIVAAGIASCSGDILRATESVGGNISERHASGTDVYEYYMKSVERNPEYADEAKVNLSPDKIDSSQSYEVVMVLNESNLLVKPRGAGDEEKSFIVHMINTKPDYDGQAYFSLHSSTPDMLINSEEQIAAIKHPTNKGSYSAQRYAIAEALAENNGIVYLEEDPTITDQVIIDSRDGKPIIENGEPKKDGSKVSRDGKPVLRAAYVWFSEADQARGDFALSLNGIVLRNATGSECAYPDHYGFLADIWRAQTNLSDYDLSTEKCGTIPAYYELQQPIPARNVNRDASDIAKRRADEIGFTDYWGVEEGLEMTDIGYRLVGIKYRRQADDLAYQSHLEYQSAIEAENEAKKPNPKDE